MTIIPTAGKQLCAGQIEVIKDNAALALMELARPPEHELRAYHFNAAGYIRQAANLAGVTDHRLRAMTGTDVWIALFPHDQEAGPRGLPTPQGMEMANA